MVNLEAPPLGVNCIMLRLLRSGVTLCAAGLAVVCLCGCSERKATEDIPAPSKPVTRVDPAKAGRDLQVARIRLEKVQRDLAQESRRLGEMRKRAMKENAAIAAMEKSFLKEREAFADRLNSWPGIREKIALREKLYERIAELNKERDAMIARLKEAKSEGDKQKVRDEMEGLHGRYSTVRAEMKTTVHAIEELRDQVRKTDPEMKALHAKLLEKHHLIYIGKVNELPEIAAVRKTQEERRQEIRQLQEQIAGLRTQMGQGDAVPQTGRRQSKEIMIDG